MHMSVPQTQSGHFLEEKVFALTGFKAWNRGMHIFLRNWKMTYSAVHGVYEAVKQVYVKTCLLRLLSPESPTSAHQSKA
jgi:hypothetical protein